MTVPIVYAVKNIYQIMVPVNCETVMWVQVGDRCFYDDSNGKIERIEELDEALLPFRRKEESTILNRVPFYSTVNILHHNSIAL